MSTPEQQSAPPGNGETSEALTILLAEDEPSLRNLLSKRLRGDGHRVIAGQDGQDALRLAEEYPDDIHVLVTDVVMPRMGGADLARAIRQKRPDIRVVFISGYAPDPATRLHLTSEAATFLAKPFPYDDLRLALRAP